MKKLTLLATCILSALTLSSAFSASAPVTSAVSNAALSQIKDNTPDHSSFWFAKNFDQVATLPGFSIAAPTGMTPSWGVVYGGVSGIMNNKTGGPATNGGASVGFGFGDAQKNVGGALTLGLPSINTNDGGFMDQGNFDLVLGHFFVDSLTGVSIGAQNLGGWNNGGGLPDRSYTISATQLLPNDVAPVVLTAGIGNGIYNFARSTNNPNTHIGFYTSAAVYVLPQLSLIADFTRGITSAGVSIVPIAQLPFVVNLGAQDLFGYQEGQNKPAFIASVTYAYGF